MGYCFPTFWTSIFCHLQDSINPQAATYHKGWIVYRYARHKAACPTLFWGVVPRLASVSFLVALSPATMPSALPSFVGLSNASSLDALEQQIYHIYSHYLNHVDKRYKTTGNKKLVTLEAVLSPIWKAVRSISPILTGDCLLYSCVCPGKSCNCSLTHWGRVMQICIFTLQLCKWDEANLRF